MAAVLVAIGAPLGTAVLEGVAWAVGALTFTMWGSAIAKRFLQTRAASEVDRARQDPGEPTPAMPRGVLFTRKPMLVRGTRMTTWVRSTDGHIFVEDVSHYLAAPGVAKLHYEVYTSERNAADGKRNRAVTWDGKPMPL